MSEMAWSAEPDDVERFVVVRVVHLAFGASTVTAGLLGEFAAFEINMGVGSAVHFLALVLSQWMGYSPLTLDLIAAFQAVFVMLHCHLAPRTQRSWFSIHAVKHHVNNVFMSNEMWNVEHCWSMPYGYAEYALKVCSGIR